MNLFLPPAPRCPCLKAALFLLSASLLFPRGATDSNTARFLFPAPKAGDALTLSSCDDADVEDDEEAWNAGACIRAELDVRRALMKAEFVAEEDLKNDKKTKIFLLMNFEIEATKFGEDRGQVRQKRQLDITTQWFKFQNIFGPSVKHNSCMVVKKNEDGDLVHLSCTMEPSSREYEKLESTEVKFRFSRSTTELSRVRLNTTMELGGSFRGRRRKAGETVVLEVQHSIIKTESPSTKPTTTTTKTTKPSTTTTTTTTTTPKITKMTTTTTMTPISDAGEWDLASVILPHLVVHNHEMEEVTLTPEIYVDDTEYDAHGDDDGDDDEDDGDDDGDELDENLEGDEGNKSDRQRTILRQVSPADSAFASPTSSLATGRAVENEDDDWEPEDMGGETRKKTLMVGLITAFSLVAIVVIVVAVVVNRIKRTKKREKQTTGAAGPAADTATDPTADQAAPAAAALSGYTPESLVVVTQQPRHPSSTDATLSAS